jgi:hypothetical protein
MASANRWSAHGPGLGSRPIPVPMAGASTVRAIRPVPRLACCVTLRFRAYRPQTLRLHMQRLGSVGTLTCSRYKISGVRPMFIIASLGLLKVCGRAGRQATAGRRACGPNQNLWGQRRASRLQDGSTERGGQPGHTRRRTGPTAQPAQGHGLPALGPSQPP